MPRRAGYSFFAGRQYRLAVARRCLNYRAQLKNRQKAIESLRSEVRRLRNAVTQAHNEIAAAPLANQMRHQLDVEQLQTEICQAAIKDLEKQLEEAKRVAQDYKERYEIGVADRANTETALMDARSDLKILEERWKQQLKMEQENATAAFRGMEEYKEKYETCAKSYQKLREGLRQHFQDTRSDFDELEKEMQSYELFEE